MPELVLTQASLKFGGFSLSLEFVVAHLTGGDSAVVLDCIVQPLAVYLSQFKTCPTLCMSLYF